MNTFSVDPYARWSYAKFGPVRLFLDMGFGVAASKYKGEVAGHEVDSDALVAWRIGVAPGIAVSLCKTSTSSLTAVSSVIVNLMVLTVHTAKPALALNSAVTTSASV